MSYFGLTLDLEGDGPLCLRICIFTPGRILMGSVMICPSHGLNNNCKGMGDSHWQFH